MHRTLCGIRPYQRTALGHFKDFLELHKLLPLSLSPNSWRGAGNQAAVDTKSPF